MATKREGVPCYDKADPDEPLFVIRAQDNLSSVIVRHWARLAEMDGVPDDKVKEARHCADLMEQWPIHKNAD